MKKLIIVVIVGFTVLLGINTNTIKSYKYLKEYKSNELLYEQLTELNITDQLPLHTNTIKSNEIEFNHIFGDDIQIIEDSISIKITINDQKRMVIDNFPHNIVYDIISEAEKKLIQETYTISNDFELIKLAYELTPKDISLISLNPKQEYTELLMLAVKDYTASPGKAYFQTPNINGIYSTSQAMTITKSLEIFDNTNKSDRMYVMFFIGEFSTEEIDTIISSLRFTN